MRYSHIGDADDNTVKTRLFPATGYVKPVWKLFLRNAYMSVYLIVALQNKEQPVACL